MAVEHSQAAGSGEAIVWEGRSARGLTFSAFDGPLMAAGSLLIVVGVGLAADGEVLIGVPVLLVGFYLLVGQMVLESYARRRTRYVLTADHASMIHSWPRERTTTIDLRRCGPSTLTRHRDGTGSITFGRARDMVSWVGPLRWSRPGFRYIDGAERLMPMIRGEAEEIEPVDGPEP